VREGRTMVKGNNKEKQWWHQETNENSGGPMKQSWQQRKPY